MAHHGSPQYWREHQMAITRRWWEKWLPSLDSDLTFEDALAGDESFVLLLRGMGLGFRERLARQFRGGGVFIFAPPVMLPLWAETFERMGGMPPGLLSIHRLHRLGEKDLQLLSDKTLIVEAPVSDRTKVKEQLARVCYQRWTIVYVHFTLGAPHKPPPLGAPHKPPRELSTALKIVNRGRAPVRVVWEPPVDSHDA